MDGMVEENGTSGSGGSADALSSAGSSASASGQHIVAVTSMVQLTLPTQAPSAQVVFIDVYYCKTAVQ